jgi:hypothetical protein
MECIMANRIEFEMSLEKLSFKFKGDYEQGQKIQAGINRAVGELTKLQAGAAGATIDVEATPSVTAALPSPIRRRKRKQTSNSPTAAVEGDDNGVEAVNGDGKPKQKPQQLLIKLRKEGFFASPQPATKALDALFAKGFTAIRANTIATVLARLCQRNVLRRTQNSDGVWVYQNGEKNE